MIRAYDEAYLSKAQVALAQMLRYGTEDLGYDLNGFFDLFLQSGIAGLFEAGDYRYTVGMSGVEMAWDVLRKTKGVECTTEPTWSLEKSPVYWTGWILAFYQWYTAHTFSDINRFVRPDEIRGMYDPYHEMDVLQFVDALNQRIPPVSAETSLCRHRKKAGLSQRELADRTGVSLRMIQNYEQRTKDINKAQAETLRCLSGALDCRIEDLMELPAPRPIAG